MESSFQVIVCECPDVNANTMALDVTGRYALMSGRKSMALVDLDGGSTDSAIGSPTTTSNDLTPIISETTQEVAPTTATTTTNRTASISNNSPVIKRLVRNSKYEPTASHFNRHIPDLYALSTYQVVEIFSIEDLNPSKPKLVLRGHSRAISDVEWSHFDPHLLGSSAADCLTNLWDIRDNRRPTATLTSVSGATQVKFSKTSSNLIATSHEIDVRIWDIRQPNLPLYYIAAHLQKINGMDWNPNRTSCDQEQLITCSQDNTIKLWDLNSNKIKPSANLQTRIPAWRVRYTPISSNAILTSTLPQLRSRSECTALKLWSMKPNKYEQKKLELILGLVGHSDVIIDFDWRARPSGTSSEVVSWSKDQTLRVWRVDHHYIEMNVDGSDFETECEVPDNTCDSMEANSLDNLNCSTSTLQSPNKKSASPSALVESTVKSSIREEHDGEASGSDQDDDLSASENLATTNELKQEFSLINKNIPNIEFEELNSLRRVCLVIARAKTITCRLRIALPPSYPHQDCPTFIIDSNCYGGESLNKEAKEKLLTLLDETAKAQLSRSRNCIEPCLRKFIAALQKITDQSSYRKRPSGSAQDYKDDPITLSAQRDHSIPFPPTSGAKFCGDLLVCFGRPMLPTKGTSNIGGSANWLVETPRSMAQLSAQLDNMRRQGSYNLSTISISYFYYGAMRRAEMQGRSGKNLSSSRIGSSKYLASRTKSGSMYAQAAISKNYKCGPVLIYDVSTLLGGICRNLAENYVFDKDVIKMCRRNAEIASAQNRKDLVQIWSLAELSSEGVLNSYIPAMSKDNEHPYSLINHDSDFGDRPWTMHPFGSKLIQSLIDHYVNNCHDVQTAAMLVWTFSSPKLGRSVRSGSRFPHSSSSGTAAAGSRNPLFNLTSNYPHTVMPSMLTSSGTTGNIETISDEWNFVSGPETHLYSNSWSNSTIHEHINELQSTTDKSASAAKDSGNNMESLEERFPKLNILSPERSLQNDLIMHIYAEVLYRLNLLNQRAMVLKNVGSNSAYLEMFGNKQTAAHDLVEERLPDFSIQCSNQACRSKCRTAQCHNCKKYSLYCSICRCPVRGSSSFCMKCLHGGHVNHYNTWFDDYDFCPTGCGCKCLSTEC